MQISATRHSSLISRVPIVAGAGRSSRFRDQDVFVGPSLRPSRLRRWRSATGCGQRNLEQRYRLDTTISFAVQAAVMSEALSSRDRAAGAISTSPMEALASGDDLRHVVARSCARRAADRGVPRSTSRRRSRWKPRRCFRSRRTEACEPGENTARESHARESVDSALRLRRQSPWVHDPASQGSA